MLRTVEPPMKDIIYVETRIQQCDDSGTSDEGQMLRPAYYLRPGCLLFRGFNVEEHRVAHLESAGTRTRALPRWRGLPSRFSFCVPVAGI
jgi:hypothetical protein